MLTSLKYPPPEAGLIVASGAFGFLAGALVAVAFADLDRELSDPGARDRVRPGGRGGSSRRRDRGSRDHAADPEQLEAFLVVSAFLVAAAIIVQFSARTRGRHYEEISP